MLAAAIPQAPFTTRQSAAPLRKRRSRSPSTRRPSRLARAPRKSDVPHATIRFEARQSRVSLPDATRKTPMSNRALFSMRPPQCVRDADDTLRDPGSVAGRRIRH